MAKLSTHVLDTSRGLPAAGVRIDLFRLETGVTRLIKTATTNADGRTDAPLFADGELSPGSYRLAFHIGDYFAASGTAGANQFLSIVPIDFVVSEAARSYHVPLLVSPWGYTTYRGS